MFLVAVALASMSSLGGGGFHMLSTELHRVMCVAKWSWSASTATSEVCHVPEPLSGHSHLARVMNTDVVKCMDLSVELVCQLAVNAVVTNLFQYVYIICHIIYGETWH